MFKFNHFWVTYYFPYLDHLSGLVLAPAFSTNFTKALFIVLYHRIKYVVIRDAGTVQTGQAGSVLDFPNPYNPFKMPYY